MICKKCKCEFNRLVNIDGKIRNLSKRKYCLKCSPFNSHNTRTLELLKDGEIFKNKAEWQRHRRQEYKRKILKIKENIGACMYCGYDEHFEILQFHHRVKEDKSFSFSVGNLGNMKWDRVLKEIKKCDLLCPNCHNWLHYQNSLWAYFCTRGSMVEHRSCTSPYGTPIFMGSQEKRWL